MWRGALAACMLVACYDPSAKPGAACTLEGSCPSGLVCTGGVCMLPGTADAAIADPDASEVDATPIDAAPAFAVRINVNGAAHTGVDYPGAWSGDDGTGGICDGMEFVSPTASINGTSDAPLFADQMFSPTLTCRVANLPSGSYRVTLLFAELRLGGAPCTGPGGVSRVFNIALEGVTVATDFNMTSACGGCAAMGGPGQAIDRTFTVDIVDGTLDFVGTASSGAAALNAIEIVAL